MSWRSSAMDAGCGAIPGRPRRSNGPCRSRRPPMPLPRCPGFGLRATRCRRASLRCRWRAARAIAAFRGTAGPGRRGGWEPRGVHMPWGTPEQVIILPRPTYLPLYTALATAAAVLTMLAGFYALSLAAALLTACLFVLAGQSAGLERDYGPLPVGHGLSLPPHTEVADAPPWWALIFALVADGTLFASLVFGTFYLWI